MPDMPIDALEIKRVQRTEILSRRSQAQRLHYGLLGSGMGTLVASPIWFLGFSYVGVALGILVAFMLLMMIPQVRVHIRRYDDELQDLDLEIDLQRFEVSNSESRAEKILRMSNFQLRRYYDLNLSQNVWVFGLGIFCILVGVGVVGATFFLVLTVATSLESKIIVGAVGAMGSILANYVAAIYLKMHASANTNLGSFHSRLVETHQLLLGNLLVASIEDAEKRSNTLAQLALNMSQHRS
jgi:uncharacterized membrane protein YgaE (UPF0421/DUF939 family)